MSEANRFHPGNTDRGGTVGDRTVRPRKGRARKRHDYLGNLLQGLNPGERFRRITEDAMCIGCGLCQSVAGADRIRMRLVENLSERPVADAALDEDTVEKIFRICPGTRVEGLPERLVEQDSGYDDVWGIWRRMVKAWAAEPDVRHLGSTGGVLTALALYLLESGEVDCIVHARAAEKIPAFGERALSRNRADVLRAAGSRYAPTATLVDIVEILDRAMAAGESIAFIGTPCDITGLRNLALEDPRVDSICRYQLAMVCGGFMAPAALYGFLADLGVERDNVNSLRYRGHGCPGTTRIETRDGRVIEKNYLDFWGEDDSAWSLPFRCKVCADSTGDAADIAVADTWVGGAPSWEGQDADPGTNAVIARSPAGEELLSRAEAAGYLATGESLAPRDLDSYQPHQVARKRAVWARFVGMRSAGRIVPDVARLRLKPLARNNGISENLNQARGAKRRCLDGSNSEPPPKPID